MEGDYEEGNYNSLGTKETGVTIKMTPERGKEGQEKRIPMSVKEKKEGWKIYRISKIQ